MKATAWFARSVHTFWATTYQLDLKLFDQFLLRELGSPPLNAVVLCDEGGLSEEIESLTDTDQHVAASANSRYLLRTVRMAPGGVFHPKTYLFVDRRKAVLLVGSGNLTRSGLDRGHEAFVEFSTEAGDEAVIAAWADWIRELTEIQDDPYLRSRYERMREVLPAADPTEQDIFRSNSHGSLMDAINDAAASRVRELHVTAPFFDEQGAAFAELVARLRPSDSIHLYLGGRTNVRGPALTAFLEVHGTPYAVHRYDPPDFVHGKLIGLVCEGGQGLLVCGSANLSTAALAHAYSQEPSAGNCEAVAFRRGANKLVRRAFVPLGLEVLDVDTSALNELRFVRDEFQPPHWPYRLIRAVVEDGCVRVFSNPAPEPLFLAWRDDLAPVSVKAGGLSETLPDEADPLICWLEDEQRNRVSNRVVIDDLHELDQVRQAGRSGTDLPPELSNGEDRSQLRELLAWAHRHFIFSVDETPAAAKAHAAQELEGSEADAEFWERLARRELEFDPRIVTYRGLSPDRHMAPPDLLLAEIHSMLQQAPGVAPRLRLATPAGSPDEGDDQEKDAGTPWSFSARERVRAVNLLRRWCRSVSDPRHAWMSPDAPARNYETLIEIFTMLLITDAIEDDERLADLLGDLWKAFIGAEGESGLIARLDAETRTELLSGLRDDTRELAAGLAYYMLHPESAWRSIVYPWQAFLVPGLELGIFNVGELTLTLIEVTCEEELELVDVRDLLENRAVFLDDATWGRRLAAEFKLRKVEIVRGFSPNVDLAVRVEGVSNAARAPSVLAIARRALELKGLNEIVLVAGDQRLLFRVGQPAQARIDGQVHRSAEPMSMNRIRAVEEEGGAFAQLVGTEIAA